MLAYAVKDLKASTQPTIFDKKCSIFHSLQICVPTCETLVMPFSTYSRLIAGQPPQMPLYKNWSHCWRELNTAGEHKRGSSLFFR